MADGSCHGKYPAITPLGSGAIIGTKPSAPENVTAEYKDNKVFVSWTAPA